MASPSTFQQVISQLPQLHPGVLLTSLDQRAQISQEQLNIPVVYLCTSAVCELEALNILPMSFTDRELQLTLELVMRQWQSTHQQDKVERLLAQEREQESVLLKKERWYSRLFENIQDIIFLFDDHGVLQDINPAACRFLDGSYDELTGKKIWEVLPEVYRDAIKRLWQEFLRTGIQINEYHFVRADGITFDIEYRAVANVLPSLHLTIARDITARKQVERELYLTQLSVDTSSASVFWITPGGDFTYVNAGACRNLAYSRKQLLTMGVGDLDPEYPVSVRPAHWLTLKQNQQLTFESIHRRSDGALIPVMITSQYLEFDDAEYELAVAIDITERKHMEQQLQSNLEFLKTLLDAIPSPVFYKDAQGIYQGCNAVFAQQILGLPKDEIVGKSVTDLPDSIPTSLAKIYHERDLALLKTQGTQIYEAQVQCADGIKRDFLFSKATYNDAAGNLAGIVGVMVDITDRRQMEAMALASEERYRTLFNTMQEAFALHEIVCDAEGKPVDYRFLEVNPAFEAFTGLKASDLIGKRVLEVLPGTEEYWITTYGKVALTGESIRFENYSQEFDRYYSVTAFSPVLGRFATIFIDITARIEAQVAVQKSYALLDKRVKERTAALSEANRRLQHEIGERENTELSLRRYAEEQAILYAVTSASTSYLAPAALLDSVLDIIIPAVKAAAGWIVLPPEMPDDPACIVASRGIPSEFLSSSLSTSSRLCSICPPLLQQTLADDTLLVTDCPRVPSEILNKVGLAYHIGVPLKAGNRMLGMLDLAWQGPQPPIELNQDLLVAIGQQVGLALHNTQLYQTALEVDRLEIVNAISSAAVSSLELDVLLRQILELTCHAIGTAEGSILLCVAGAEELAFAQTLSPDSHKLMGKHIAWGQGVAGWIAEHKETVCVNNVHRDSRWDKEFDALLDYETRSLLGVPLIYQERVIGVLEIVNKTHGDFIPEDITLLESVASIAAAALENARLFTSTRVHAKELAALNDIGLTLASSLEPQSVIQSALTRIQHLFNADSVVLVEPDAPTGNLQFVQALVEGKSVTLPPLPEAGAPDTVAWFQENPQTLLVGDVLHNGSWSEWVYEYLQKYMGTCVRAMMATPLKVQDQIMGAIFVINCEPDIYNIDDLHFLQTLGTTLAVMLENAQLYADLKKSLHEREQAESKLIHAEKMSALGRLAASIAHEINNPLQSVLGCLRLSQEEMEGQFRKSKLERHIDVAVNEVKRVSEIVHRMHDFYRQARAELRPTDVNIVLDSVLSLSNKQLQHSGVMVMRHYDSELPLIQANADHLRQVFLNMILNAIDAMPAGGNLTIQTSQPSQIIPGGIEILFRDNGVGMSPEVLSQIFEPFFTTKERGSGLGLSISYGIIESHNGDITVSSQEGKGTTFTIILPVEQP
ncbi:MAG: PAS domain S-box protein [Anaerolineae bacterium]|nr:PAS domain S-box protein [Anaerolineae bacterium]